jgi:predicted MFS family arabinose efflux permease
MLNPPYASILYAIATIIYQIFWSFIVPVMMATFSDIDKSGRLIVFCVSAFKIGLVLGTPFAGYLITVGDLYDVVWASAVAIVISGMFLVTAVKLNGSDTATK